MQHSDNLETKVTEVRSQATGDTPCFILLQRAQHWQVKFQLKKVLCMGVAVGNVAMTPDELRHPEGAWYEC